MKEYNEILNLDKTFEPFGKSTFQFEALVFSGGEPHIKIVPKDIPLNEPIIITNRINSFHEMGLMAITVDSLKRMGHKNISVFIPYFPGARQDRVMVKGESLTVKVYADIVNHFDVEKVIIFDPHSEVTAALLDNVDVIDNHSFISNVFTDLAQEHEHLILASPDGGALKKIYKLSEYLGGIEVVECSKSRDVKTGKLTGFKVYADDLKNKTIVIVDDIIDAGGTFIGLSTEFKNKNAGKLYLAVTHGIFSKGYDSLTKCFDGIYTTDSFKDIDQPKITQFKINGLLH